MNEWMTTHIRYTAISDIFFKVNSIIWVIFSYKNKDKHVCTKESIEEVRNDNYANGAKY